MPTFADRQLRLLTRFPVPTAPLPPAVEVRTSYHEPAVQALVRAFADKFYARDQPRVGVFGINPGRVGGGRTGVAFTDPVAMATNCGLLHDLPRQRRELSSEFVYLFIEALGGPAEFYQHFFLGAVYPLEITRAGVNYNYYDAPALTRALWADMKLALTEQVRALHLRPDVAVSLGRRNGEFLRRLNDELGLFGRVETLDHPRFLMQYRRKSLAENVARYVEVLGSFI